VVALYRMFCYTEIYSVAQNKLVREWLDFSRRRECSI